MSKYTIIDKTEMQPGSAVAAVASTVDNAIQRAALIFCGDKIPSLKREGGSRRKKKGEGMKDSAKWWSLGCVNAAGKLRQK